jgi:cobalamin biosynthesis protein CobD/CbiB
VLLAVALLIAPALVALVARLRFPQLQAKQGASLWRSVVWSLGSALAALAALVVSMPLWAVPPLILVLPPLIWGWLTYRVMAFDALSQHASDTERRLILRRHRLALLAMGVGCGFLGAAPSVVWASTLLFAAAFPLLLPVAVWIYTLVFIFSALWFSHYCLAALQALRAQSVDAGGAGVVLDAAVLPQISEGTS